MAGTDKGKFSTGIGQDVIEEALRAVQKRSEGVQAGLCEQSYCSRLSLMSGLAVS